MECASRRLRVPAAAAAALLIALGAAGCGRGAVPVDAQSLVEGALAQQFFDSHHQIPSNQQEATFGQEASGMLQRVYALPAPPPLPEPLPIDVNAVRQAGGQAGVQEALLAAYVLHFHALPDGAARQAIQTLVGAAGEAPIPVVGLKQLEKMLSSQSASGR
jgi:hypothetical protein